MNEVLTESKQESLFRKLLAKEENNICADCKVKGTAWVSLSFGIFVCINCSGVHRSFGMHITRVRSTKLDSWTVADAKIMETIGNKLANMYWENKLDSKPSSLSSGEFIRMKYDMKKWVKPGVEDPVSALISSGYSARHDQLMHKYGKEGVQPQCEKKVKPKHEAADLLGMEEEKKQHKKKDDLLDLFADADHHKPKKTSSVHEAQKKCQTTDDLFDFTVHTQSKAHSVELHPHIPLVPSGPTKKTDFDFDFSKGSVSAPPNQQIFNIQNLNIFNGSSSVMQMGGNDKYAVFDSYKFSGQSPFS